MTAFLPRLFYTLAALACYVLLQPNPVTLFMAACFSCLTLPLYRRMKIRARRWKRTRPQRSAFTILLLSRHGPLYSYAATIVVAVLIPISILVILVSPQAAAGLARLRELQANNFQLPPQWVEFLQQWRAKLSTLPQLEKLIDEVLNDLDTLFSDAVRILVNKSFSFLDGTMTVIWTTFLFFTLTVLFSVYSRQIRIAAGRVLHLRQCQLRRFILAVYKALRAVMLGIVLVALAQGVLCGVGFAVAGVRQPAFWGMLATLVAPIPFVGTALVWIPLCLSLWFTGKTMAAVGLALWGMLAVAGVDNILRPFFLRQGIDAPFIVLMLTILCGMASLGPVGIIAGPVLFAFALQAVKEANQCYPAHDR